ncbi:[protein-PII] uridylyltransferase [Maricaulaceae bacterium MS644]
MRPSSLPAALDGLRLRAELAASTRVGWDKPAARSAALAKLKAYLEKGRRLAESRLGDSTGGLEAARTLSSVMNAALRALFDSVAMDLVDEGARAPGLALCALGGFGAGELAPKSDIDLVFLVSDPAPDWAPLVIERTLYALWDSGLTIGGGAVRTVDEAIALATDDVSERTALLDMRSITGDLTLVRELLARFDTELLRPNAAAFAAEKLAERDARVVRQGDSRYQVEPNVKDGKGALRDLQTLRWLAQVLYGDDALERWVGDGLFSVSDVERYLSAADFFWTVRFHIHDLVGGKDDRLTFDIQPETAARMGFADTADQLGVEMFMRTYFKKAIDVGALTRLVCAKLEADHLKDLPGGTGRFMPSDGDAEDTGLAEAGFRLHAGRLDFADTANLERDPGLMLRLFETAASRHFDLHPDAVADIAHSLRQVDESFRTDPRAARSFFAVLLDADDPRMTLRAMTEAGLLGAYIPEFGDIVARTQFNMYHRFTVDEHTLNALGILRDIESGRLLSDHPLASRLVHQITHRRALHLAVLLHDTGKGKGDQCVEGAANARIACARLGLDDDETELVAWLIANHLEMSDTAQRRDISDPRTVLDFAQTCGTLERLRLLTVLTVVDIRAVGPGVWNGWKAQLLRDLHAATTEVLKDGGHKGDESAARARLAQRADQSRDRFRAAMERLDPAFAQDWADQLEASYWLAFSETDRLRHAAFARAAKARGANVAAGVRVDRRRSATEVMVIAPDRDALFADIAGALALEGANVVGAQVTTTSDGRAFDVFFVQETGGKPHSWADPFARDRLKAAVERAARDGLPDACAIAERPIRRREAAFTVTPYLKIDEEAADNALVIEASGRDRPGLLHALARTLAENGLSVEGARIDGYGERAVDTFYVTEKGAKPTDPARLAAVSDALEQVLADAEEAASATRAAAGLAQAPASVGR